MGATLDDAQCVRNEQRPHRALALVRVDKSHTATKLDLNHRVVGICQSKRQFTTPHSQRHLLIATEHAPIFFELTKEVFGPLPPPVRKQHAGMRGGRAKQRLRYPHSTFPAGIEQIVNGTRTLGAIHHACIHDQYTGAGGQTMPVTMGRAIAFGKMLPGW